MTSLPITLNLAAATAQPAAQNASAHTQNSNVPQFDEHVQDSQPTAPRQQNGRSSNNTPANSNDNGNSQFGRLLASKQKSDVVATINSAPLASTKDVSAKDTTPAADDTAAVDTTDASNETATILSLLMQLQSQPAPASPVTNTDIAPVQDASAAAPAAPQDATPAPIDDLIKQLTTLLQQALGQPQGDDSTPADATAQATPLTPATDSNKDTGNTPNDLSALVQAMLQQLGQPAPAAPQAQATDVQTAKNDIAITSATASNAAPSLTDALNKLAAMLEPKPVAASTGETTDTATAAVVSTDEEAPAAASAPAPVVDTAAPAPKEKAAKPVADVSTATDSKPATAQPQPDKHAFQQAISDVIDALTTKNNSKQDDQANTAANNVAAPIAAPAPAQAPQSSDFTKQLAQPQAPPAPQDQVMVHIKNAVSDGTSQIRIQLHPEDMGKVDVQLNTDASGKTSVTITSDNRHTLAMLQNEARSLQDALRDIGLKTDGGSLNFNLRDSGQDARNSSKQQQGGYTVVAGISETEDTGFSTAGSLYRVSVVQQGLDIHV